MSLDPAQSDRRWRKKPVRPARRGSRTGSCAARRGFTLIELLVVVAIIALLISILLPSLRQAREQAKQVVCMSNMQQMGVAMLSYALNNREYVPGSSCPLAEPDIEHPEELYWLTILQKYTNQTLIGRCCGDKTDKRFLDWAHPPPREEWTNYRWSSYAINACLGPLKSDLAVQRLNRIRTPAAVIYLAEIRSGDSYDYADHIHSDMWEGQEDPKQSVAWDRHLERSNYLFADSHVEAVRWKKTWDFPRVNLWWPRHAPGWPPELIPPSP